MEPIFENQFTLTKEYYTELNRKSSNYKTTIFLSLLLGIGILLVAVSAFVFSWRLQNIYFFPIWGAMVIIIPLIGYNYRIKCFFQKMQLMNNEKDPTYITQITDRIKSISFNGAQSTFEYSQVTKVWETSQILVLQINSSIWILLKKDAFTIGSCQEFEKFIKERCSKAKINLINK